MITYQQEKYRDIVGELGELYQLHYEEVAENKDAIKLEPDFERYLKMDEMDILLLVTVRDSKKLIGYFKVLITPHLHYKSSLTAGTDIFYLHPEYRSGGIGMKMFQFMMEKVKDRGVQRMYTTCKLSLDLDPMLRKLGFNPIERNYSIVFD